MLIKELQGLSLNVVPVGATVYNDTTTTPTPLATNPSDDVKQEEKLEKEVKEFEEELGAQDVLSASSATEDGLKIEGAEEVKENE